MPCFPMNFFVSSRLIASVLIAGLTCFRLVASLPATESNPVAVPAPSKAETLFWQALKAFNSGKAADLPAGRVALQAAADAEFTHAQLLLGNCLLSGSYGFKKDERKGASLFRLAAERGNAFALVSLGQCHLAGTGVSKNETKAADWFTAALAPTADYTQPIPPADYYQAPGSSVAGGLQRDPATETRASAHFFLGQILNGRQQPELAHAHFLAAATAGPEGRFGVAAAAQQAAFNYAFGNGVPRDLAQATTMLDLSRQLATRQNVSLVHNSVATKTVDEFAVADLEEAITKSGEQIQAGLQLKIAATLGDKKSKDYNPREAARWYQLAAESGQAWAMLELAFMHSRDDLGPPNRAEAFRWFEKAGAGDKPKHYLATANLGLCYLRGLGTTADAAKAAALFAKARDYTFLGYLGTIGQAPAEPVDYETDKKTTDTWAQKKDDAHAQYLVGLRHYTGWDGKVDLKESVRWFKKAAKASHGGALCQLGVIYELKQLAPDTKEKLAEYQRRIADVLEYYRRSSEAGNIEGLINYATMLSRNLRTNIPHTPLYEVKEKNLLEAEAQLLAALARQPHHPRAHNNLAVIYEQRLREGSAKLDPATLDKFREKMLHHYQEAVLGEFAYAALNLGTIYYDGKLASRDFGKAYEYFGQAASWGLTAAHYSLGYMHERGEGVPRTPSEAAYHYRLAGLDGHVQALQNLANLYLSGQGVALDLERAAFWLNQLVQRGNTEALASLADLFMRKKDYEAAFKIFLPLSTHASRELAGLACERLSQCYARGLGVKADQAQAKKYFELAIIHRNGDALASLAKEQFSVGEHSQGVETMTYASTRSAGAAFHLGQMYYFGTHVTKDEGKALQLLKNAANAHHPEAQVFLATMTYKNLPQAPTLEEALNYAERAEAHGLEKATVLREALEKKLKARDVPPEEGARARAS